jgi:ankyrin repeat protein
MAYTFGKKLKKTRQLEEILADAYFHNSACQTGVCEINGNYLCGTPLHLFATRGDFEACKVLLDSGALVDIRDGDGYTQLHAAAEQGHLECVKLLLARGSNPSLSTPMDTTCALAEDYPDIIKAIKKEAEQGGDGDAEEAV